MAEAAPPWQQNTPYEVRVTAKPLRSLTYDVLPPAPSSDTTAVVQEAGGAVVVKRASNGAEREFRGRSAKTTPLDAALIFDAKAGTFELRRVAAAAVKLAPPPPASLAPSPKKKPGARKRAPTQRFSAMTDGGKTYRPAPPAPADEEAELVCQPRKKARPEKAPAKAPAAKPTAKKKASATGEDAKSLVDRAAPIAVVQKNPKRAPRRRRNSRLRRGVPGVCSVAYVETNRSRPRRAPPASASTNTWPRRRRRSFLNWVGRVLI